MRKAFFFKQESSTCLLSYYNINKLSYFHVRFCEQDKVNVNEKVYPNETRLKLNCMPFELSYFSLRLFRQQQLELRQGISVRPDFNSLFLTIVMYQYSNLGQNNLLVLSSVLIPISHYKLNIDSFEM